MTIQRLDKENFEHQPEEKKHYYLLGALCGIVFVFGTAFASVYLFKDKVDTSLAAAHKQTLQEEQNPHLLDSRAEPDADDVAPAR